MVSGDPDEKVLIERAQRDPRRFADLYALHFERVYAFIARRVPARSDVQDLTSEVFKHALTSIGRFEWRGCRLRRGCTGLRRTPSRTTTSVPRVSCAPPMRR